MVALTALLHVPGLISLPAPGLVLVMERHAVLYQLNNAAPTLLQLLGSVLIVNKIQVTGRNKGRVLYVYMFRFILPILVDNDKRGMIQRGPHK